MSELFTAEMKRFYPVHEMDVEDYDLNNANAGERKTCQTNLLFVLMKINESISDMQSNVSGIEYELGKIRKEGIA